MTVMIRMAVVELARHEMRVPAVLGVFAGRETNKVVIVSALVRCGMGVEMVMGEPGVSLCLMIVLP